MDSSISINGALKSSTGSTAKYGENLLAGLLGELFDAGKVADNGAKTPVTVNNGKGDKIYNLITLDLAEGIKTQPYLTADSIGKNVYIKLEDFCDLINRFLMLSNNQGNLILLRTRDYNGKALLCRAHPFQISAHPGICLIRPDFWLETTFEVSEKDKKKAKEVQKATQDTSYGNPSAVNDEIKEILNSNDYINKNLLIIKYLNEKLKNTRYENFNDLKNIIDNMFVQLENWIKKIDTKKEDNGTYTVTYTFGDNKTLTYKNLKSLNLDEIKIGFGFNNNISEESKTTTLLTLLNPELVLDADEPFSKLASSIGDQWSIKLYELVQDRLLAQQFNKSQIEAGQLVDQYESVSETSKDIQYGLSALKPLDPYFVKNDRYKGIIGNIYLNLDYIYKLIAPIGTETSDNKRENNKNLANILKQLLTEVQNNIGSINDFELFVDPTFNVTRIIDKNLIEGTNNVYSITVDNKASTAKSYGILSNIFPEQSNTIAISAQAKSGVLGEKTQHLVAYNKGIQDRIIGNEINSRASITSKITTFDNADDNNPTFKALSAIADSLSIYTPLSTEVVKRVNSETNPTKKREAAIEAIEKKDKVWYDFNFATATDENIFRKLDELY